MPKILDLPKKPPSLFPLIEILAPIDTGKTFISKLVAKRIDANIISFPILDPMSWTGRALLSSLTTYPEKLLNSPEWWAHMYIANIFEQKNKIIKLLQDKPLIVTNYLFSYRMWMNSTGMDMSNFLKGFSAGLPVPNIGYVCTLDSVAPTYRPKFNFPDDFSLKIKRAMQHTTDTKIVKVSNTTYSPFIHTTLNNICRAISTHACKKFKLTEIDVEYTIEHFPLKKDLK